MPYIFVTDTGTIVADTSAVLLEVQEEFKAVFGDDIVLSPESPEGVLIAAEVASRVGIANNNAQLANQINPNIAGGTYLDAIWALLGGARSPGTPSTVVCDVAGTPATLIPEGSLASTAAGDEWASTGDVTLDGGGVGTVTFASVELGPIEALAGELTTIVTGVIGWETVTNPLAAALGLAAQTDISARRERRQTLALVGAGTAEAVLSRVRAVSGVRSAQLVENITNAGAAIGGVFVFAHSIYVSVDGGTDNDIALALLESKNAGSGWTNGNGSATPVTVPTVDPFSGQLYNVLFDRAEPVPVLSRVTVSANGVSNTSAVVKQAVLDYTLGLLDGEDGFVIGASVSPFEIAGAINSVEPRLGVTVSEVTLQSVVNYQPTTILFNRSQIPTIQESGITVTVI